MPPVKEKHRLLRGICKTTSIFIILDMKMKYKIILLLFFTSLSLFATHNQSGLITWQYVSGYTYKLRVTTFTEINAAGGNADRCKLTIYISHADSVTLLRTNGPNNNPSGDCKGTTDGVEISVKRKINIYEGTYTFPCFGRFILSCYDPNRNAGIINIPNSVSYPMYFESEILVPKSDYVGSRNSIDIIPSEIVISPQSCLKYTPFYMNPNGDSLAYSLIPCQYSYGSSIPGYSMNGFAIHSKSGKISTTNTMFGQYNLCVKIKMYRNSEYIGSVNYDHSLAIVSNTQSVHYKNFVTNLPLVNGVYNIAPGQTLTLSDSVLEYYPIGLLCELTGTIQQVGVSGTFSLSVSHSTALARPQPYSFYIGGASVGRIYCDTLIRIRMTGFTNTVTTPMAVSTPTCFLPGRWADFFIYPTICKERLYLTRAEFSNLRIYDTGGRKIEAVVYQNTVDVETFAPGVYFLVVTLGDNKDHSFKFVKN
jgi:hypothetical protein